jgi:4-amino-4-deoxy-L-arabinose transferase-like glycosyltransferase
MMKAAILAGGCATWFRDCGRFFLSGRFPSFCRRHPQLALVLGAFLVRLAFLVFYGPTAPPVPWGDDQAYDKIAATLVTQHEYSNTWYPPGYPLFLAVIYLFCDQSWLIVRIIQALLGAATCVLLQHLGRRLFSNRVGFIAAVLLALYPGHVYFTWRLMGETLYIFLIVLGLLQAHRLIEHPRLLQSLVLGLVIGFAQLVKSNLFPLPALLLIWFAATAHAGMSHRVLCTGSLAAGLMLMAGVTPLANFIASGREAALLSGIAGRTLWVANNPSADGYFNSPQASVEGRAFITSHGFKERLERANFFEQDRLCRDLALIWIRENPGQFAILCLKKLNNAFGLFPRARVLELDSRARWAHLLTYGFVALFALVGLIASRRCWRSCSLLYLVLLSYGMMVVAFYGTPRFTLLVVPVLIIFASHGMATLLKTVWHHHWAES